MHYFCYIVSAKGVSQSVYIQQDTYVLGEQMSGT